MIRNTFPQKKGLLNGILQEGLVSAVACEEITAYDWKCKELVTLHTPGCYLKLLLGMSLQQGRSSRK